MAKRRDRRGQSQCACGAGSGPPSTIFHLAGGSSVGLSIAQPYEDFSRTVASTARLLEWLRGSATDCRLIVASSAAVYGAESQRADLRWTPQPVPMSPYGQHKLMMEQLCRSYAVTFGLRSTVARLFSVYGPNLRKQLLWDMCSRLQAGERTLVLGGTGAEVRDWIDVRDVDAAVGQDRRRCRRRRSFRLSTADPGLERPSPSCWHACKDAGAEAFRCSISGIVRPATRPVCWRTTPCCVRCRLTGKFRLTRDLRIMFRGSRNRPGERSGPIRVAFTIFLAGFGPVGITIRATCLRR